MIQDNGILKELNGMNSSLADIERTMPYALPDAYFDALAERLVQDVLYSESEEPGLALDKSIPFTIPEGYFTSLPDDLAQAAAGSSLNASVAMPYDTPAGYFHTLPGDVLAAATGAGTPVRKGAIIAFRPQWQKQTAQWAAAAVFVMGVWFGTYKYMHPAVPDAIATKQLSKVDGDAIDAYVEQHADELDTEMLEASVAAVKTDFHTPISGLDEQDIKDYLDETGEINPKSLN